MKYRYVSLPGRGGANPYIDLLYDALSKYNVDLVGEAQFNMTWLKDNIDSYDAIHLHWPERIWRKYTPKLVDFLEKTNVRGFWRASKIIENQFNFLLKNESIDFFENCLNFLKNKKKKIVWTWHNIVPHEGVESKDRKGYQILARKADLIIFHSDYALNSCKSSYEILGKTVVMPIGNYVGVYPEPRSRSVVMHELGLNPALPVVGCLGAIRNYKGLDIASEAIKRLEGIVQFLCAGKPHKDFECQPLEREISSIRGTVFIPRLISNQEFSDFANVCEFQLLPYKKNIGSAAKIITGSAALLTSLSLNKGVVASDLPYFREVLKEYPEAGVLVTPDDPVALAYGILKYLEVSKDVRSRAAKYLADKYDWDIVVKSLIPYLIEKN